MKKIRYFACLLATFIAFSCKKPYQPPVVAGGGTYLVVEGFINSGPDSTFIKLSHTVNLNDTVKTAAERGASVAVEGNSERYPLAEIRPGVYSALPLSLQASQKYHLVIKLSNGKEYRSDDAGIKVSPPIDTIAYDVKDNGIQIKTTSHDPTGNTRYYRWEYEETWMFHPLYLSRFKVVDRKIVRRNNDEDIFTCFTGRPSSTVVLATTAKLSSDVASNVPITQIASTSEKISVRYSMLLKQYALTKEAFDFWENLKKNTEQLGSIFDALPSEISGNIHNVADAKEPVIGYISAGTMRTKRIFIDKSDLPGWLREYPYQCYEDTTLFKNPLTGADDVAFYIIDGKYLATFELGQPGGPPIGYGRTSRECADCTVRGYLKRPVFWKDR